MTCNCKQKKSDDPLNEAVVEIKEGQEGITDEIKNVKSQVKFFEEKVKSDILDVKNIIIREM